MAARNTPPQAAAKHRRGAGCIIPKSIPPFCLSDFNISERPTKSKRREKRKTAAQKRRLFLVAIFHYTARVTLPERRHLVQTYT